MRYLEKVLAVGAVATMLLSAGDSAYAQTFPAPATAVAPFWIPITRGGAPIADAVNAQADLRDIVGDATHSAAYIASDANFLYLRLRLNGSPGTVGAITDNHAFGCAIDTDGTLTTYELLLTLDGNGADAIKLAWNSTAGTAGTTANQAETNLATIASSATNTEIVVAPDTTFSSNPDAFVDFAISWATFRTKVGASPTITSATALRFICGTSIMPVATSNQLENDIYDGAAALTFSAATTWSDAYTCNNGGNPRCVTATDTDGDGVQNATETTLGTSPTNFDSDADGIPDWFELRAAGAATDIAFTAVNTDGDSKIDALDTDSDNDCVPDSVEGLATYRNPALPNTDKNVACTSTPLKPLCDTLAGACSACNGDNASGAPLACPAATAPVCQTTGALTGSCTACDAAETTLCTGGMSACESTTGACSACNGDHGSAATAVCTTATAPACNASGANAGSCTQCSATNVSLCTAALPACAADTGACSACTGDNGATTNAACPTTATPACNLAGAFAGRCTVCSATNTALCPAAKPACDPGGGVCAKCDGDRGTGSALQCPSDTAPLCVLLGPNLGTCIKCTSSTDCGAGHAGPTCDMATGQCVDIDTDKDGLQDAIEILLGTDPTKADTDGDGIGDEIEVTPVGGGAFAKVDSDGDNIIDALDTDSDNDTVLDADESGITATVLLPIDTDGDGTPNFRDIDDDNDQIATASELKDAKSSNVDDDVDGDGKKNWDDSDANGNGIPDGQDGRGDTDGDGILNYLDLTPNGGTLPVDAGAKDAGTSSSSSSSSGSVIKTPTGDAGTATNGAAPEDGVVEGSGGCNTTGSSSSLATFGLGILAIGLASRRRRRR